MIRIYVNFASDRAVASNQFESILWICPLIGLIRLIMFSEKKKVVSIYFELHCYAILRQKNSAGIDLRRQNLTSKVDPR